MPPISPIYCLNCRQQMPGDSPTCPSCGAVVGSVASPTAREDARRAGNRAQNRIAVTVALVIAAPAVLGYAGCASLLLWASSPKAQADAAALRARQIEGIESLRPTLEQTGARIRYDRSRPDILTITMPGPVGQYEAERVARSIADRLPGVGVVVADDVGITRGRSF